MIVEVPGTKLEIVRNPEIREGKPVLAGTRLGVHTIVGYHRHYAGDVDRILAEFPTVTREQIEAALSWYEGDEEHRAEIDAILSAQHAFFDAGLAAQRARGQASGG